ncbi:MAG: DUF1573 domain-containing protein [Pirellulaceae bacterium]|nr:DUF1573 domain-containing protein [Pirellulaceae bacterium]
MMKRAFVCIAVAWLIGGLGSDSAAATWARRLFEKTKHDFGTVARAAATEYSFKFTNYLNQDVRVAYVRSSCGCTKPRIEKRAVKSGESSAVIAKFDTRTFHGNAGATVTVVFDRPRYAEVQLRVSGYIRRDVVFHPGRVDFGSVEQGRPTEKAIDLQYAGRNDWRVVSVRSPLPFVTVETHQTRRRFGRVGYQLLVRVSEDAPAGYINTELLLETNDRRLKSVPLAVNGRVSPSLSVSPALLYLGNVPAGGRCEKRLLVRGPQPFRITKIECGDQRFQFKTGDEAKKLHFVPVEFRADDVTGEVSQTIEVHTDLADGKLAKVNATGTVLFPITSIVPR